MTDYLQEEDGEEVRLAKELPVEHGADGGEGGVAGAAVRTTEVEAETEQLVNAVEDVGERVSRAACSEEIILASHQLLSKVIKSGCENYLLGNSPLMRKCIAVCPSGPVA